MVICTSLIPTEHIILTPVKDSFKALSVGIQVGMVRPCVGMLRPPAALASPGQWDLRPNRLISNVGRPDLHTNTDNQTAAL